MDLPQAVQFRIAVLGAAEGGSPGWAGAAGGADAACGAGGACMYGAAPGAGGTAPPWAAGG